MNDLKLHVSRPAAWIEVTGDDAFTFLQGQASNDLRAPNPPSAVYTLWLDRKGKVLADSFVLRERDDLLYLYSYESPAATILERLEAFIIADDVVLRDRTETAASASLWGAALSDVLAKCDLQSPGSGTFFRRGNDFLLRGRRSASPNVDLVIAGGDLENATGKLSAVVLDAGGGLADEAEVERERIASLIPAIPRDVGPKDLPQEGRLETSAVSFEKGCYLGQEVMARIRAMGQVRRTLVQVRVDASDLETPAALYDGDREIGSLRSIAAPPSSLGLALVRNEVAKESAKFALEPNGPATVEIIRISES